MRARGVVVNATPTRPRPPLHVRLHIPRSCDLDVSVWSTAADVALLLITCLLLLPTSSSLALVHPLSVSVCGEPRESDTPMCYTWSGTDCPPSPYQFLHTFPPTRTLFIGTQPSNRPKLLFSTPGLMFHCYAAVLCSLLIASSDFRGRLTAAGCSPPPPSPGVLSDVMFPSSARVGQEVDVG